MAPQGVILEMSGFTPILNFGHFWAALLKMSSFTHSEIFVNFGPTPLVQLSEALFLAEEEAQNVEIFNPLKILAIFGHPPHPFDHPKCH